jgi:hypothetical protein
VTEYSWRVSCSRGIFAKNGACIAGSIEQLSTITANGGLGTITMGMLRCEA